MQGKKAFVLFADVWETVKELPMDKRGELFTAILLYSNNQQSEINDLLIRVAFGPIKANMDRMAEKWEERAERSRKNGNKGGRPKNLEQPNETQQVFQEPRKPVIGKVNGTVTAKEKGNSKIDSTRFLSVLETKEFVAELLFKGFESSDIKRGLVRFLGLNESKSFDSPEHLKNSFLKFIAQKNRVDFRINPKRYHELISSLLNDAPYASIFEEKTGIALEPISADFVAYAQENSPILENFQHAWNLLIQFTQKKTSK